MGGGGWSRADPVAHKQTRARFLFVGTAAAQCCPARRGRRGARSTAAGRAHAPRLQRDRVHHVEDSRRHRCDERVDDDGLQRRRWWGNRVRRRDVSTSAPGGAGCAAHGRASPSRLSRPSRATLVKRSESRAGRESVLNGAAAPRALAPATARLGIFQKCACVLSTAAARRSPTCPPRRG